MFMLKVPKEMLIRGKRKVVIQSVEDDGFPENLATAKQKMVKRGENTSYLGQNTKVSENFFQAKSESILQRVVLKGRQTMQLLMH